VSREILNSVQRLVYWYGSIIDLTMIKVLNLVP
jgi:hypothetical protein